MRNMSYFGDKLREARKAAGYTQEELAQALGIIRTNYIPYETGKKRPDPEFYPQLCKLLGIPDPVFKAWIRLDGATSEEKMAILTELYSDQEIEIAAKKELTKRGKL